MDWLRVLAVLLLFPFHTLRVFDANDPFYVKSAVTSMPVTYLLAFIDRWHMPLLFLLAGASTYLAMRRRTPREYVGERAKRLLTPFALGLLLLIPPQTFVGGRFNSGYGESYLHYLVSGDFLVWNIRSGGDYYGGFGIGHLWFVLWLFAVSLLALPLVTWARRDTGSAWVRRWAARLSSPVWWLLPPLLILLGDALPDVAGKNPFYYLVFFALGFVTISDPAFAQAAERRRWPALVTGSAIAAAFALTWQWRGTLADPSAVLAIVNYVGFIGTWLAIVAAVGFGRHHLDAHSPLLSYLAEASYPVYILHQTVIVLLAAWIVALPIAWPLQWTALLMGSVVATFAIYELVRHSPLSRFVLGMKRRSA